MPTKRINAITTTATVPSSDDYEVIDGTTNGTRRILASRRESMLAARESRQGVISAGTGVLATTADNTSLAFGTGDLTIGGWFKLSDWTPASTVFLVSKNDNTADLGVTVAINATDGLMRLNISDGATQQTFSSTAAPSLTDGQWAFLAWVQDVDGSFTPYAQGVQVGSPVDISSLSAQTRTNTASLYTLASATGTTPYAGTVGETFIANRVLTAAEVAQIHANGTAVGVIDEADMYQHHVPSETLAAGIFEDVSGNHNHAVLGTSGITFTHTYNLPSVPAAQALVSDGRNLTKLYNTLGDQGGTITGDLALLWSGLYPLDEVSNAQTLVALTDSLTAVNSADGLWMAYTLVRGLSVYIFEASGSDYLVFESVPLHQQLMALSARGIKATLLFSRSGDTPRMFMAVEQGPALDVTNLFDLDTVGTPPASWDEDVLGDYLVGFYRNTSSGLSSEQTLSDKGIELLNTAPTLAEFEYRVKNGAWEDKFAKGDSTPLPTVANNRTFDTDTGYWTKLGAAAIAAGSATGFGASSSNSIFRSSAFVAGEVYEITLTTAASVGSWRMGWALVSEIYIGTASGSDTIFANNGDNTFTAIVKISPAATSAVQLRLGIFNTSGVAGDYTLENIEYHKFGVTTSLDLSDGGGFQPKNPRAENGSSHWTMSTTGITWRNPNRIGKTIIGTLAASTSAQQVTGASVIPSGWEIVRIRAKADSGTPNIIVGNISGGAQIVASEALSTSWKALTLVGGIHITSTKNLWATLDASVIVRLEFDIQPRGTI